MQPRYEIIYQPEYHEHCLIYILYYLGYGNIYLILLFLYHLCSHLLYALSLSLSHVLLHISTSFFYLQDNVKATNALLEKFESNLMDLEDQTKHADQEQIHSVNGFLFISNHFHDLTHIYSLYKLREK